MGTVISPAFVSRFQTPRLQTLPPLALYIHIPWCIKKCPYCDFNSHAIRDNTPLPEEAYVTALIRDMEFALQDIWGRKVSSIFLGGGTPSVFSPRSIDRILSAARTLLSLEPLVEITMEANPGTFETEKFAGFRAAGINRLSIGIQSFNPVHLQKLGRIHDHQEAHRAIDIALTHFDNVNLDLMYALPDQTMAEARSDIGTACASGVTHISAYHLTLEPNTFFHRYPPALPDDDTAADMQQMIEELLANHGYRNYEISAFARAGRECRHNLNYWMFGDYLGIGAGAHSKISFADRIVRQMRYKQPAEYLARSYNSAATDALIQEQHTVSVDERAFEFMMNALRLSGGFATELFQERTGLPLTHILRPLDIAEQRGLILSDHQHIAPTLAGKRFLNDLLQLFLPEQKET